MENKKSISGKFMLAVSVFVCVFVVSVYSSIPNPGHSASQVGSGVFYGVEGDVWSFPGSVGIGVVSPESPLQVSSGVSSYGFLHLVNTVPGGEAALSFRSSDQSFEDGWTVGKGVGLTGTGFSFYGNSATRLTITDNGSVGIGTTTPLYNLHVVGNIYASGNITCGGSNCGGVGGNVSGGYWNLSGSSLYPVSTSYNVGIGTVAPRSKLHIEGAGRTALLVSAPSTSSGAVGDFGLSLVHGDTPLNNGTTNQIISWSQSFRTDTFGAGQAGSLVVYRDTAFTEQGSTGSNWAIALKPNLDTVINGNVGIGTTNPGYLLTLGAGSAVQVFGVENSKSFVAKNSAGAYEEWVWPRWSDNVMYMNYGSGGFNIRNNSSVSTMFMTSTGNVGIGTKGPIVKLHVNDATGGDGEVARFAWANAASKETLLGFTYRADDSTNPPVEIGYRVDSDGWTGVSKGSLVFKTRSVTTDTAPSEIMRISSTGNVGIGTTSPGAKLDVRGSVITDGNNVGAMTFNVANYFTQDSTGDYIHIRLPFDPTVSNNMFHIHVTGYAYQGGRIIDLTYVGYAYTGTGTIINTATLDPTGLLAPYIYKGSDNKVYLRFTPGSTYFLTCKIDSMYVGNGRVILPGEVTITHSASATL